MKKQQKKEIGIMSLDPWSVVFVILSEHNCDVKNVIKD